MDPPTRVLTPDAVAEVLRSSHERIGAQPNEGMSQSAAAVIGEQGKPVLRPARGADSSRPYRAGVPAPNC